MDVQSLAIPDVKVIVPRRFEDERGFFSETWQRRRYGHCGIDVDFVQDNHAFSRWAWTMRGLHFQTPPRAQDKLVRVVAGSILDVVVDIRRGSPYYGLHVCVPVSAKAGNQVFVPAGFAHGLITLEDNTEVLYRVSDYYSPDHDRGLLWNDPCLGIDWPVEAGRVILSKKDREQPPLADLPDYFVYHGESG